MWPRRRERGGCLRLRLTESHEAEDAPLVRAPRTWFHDGRHVSDVPIAMARSTYSYGDHPSQLAELFRPAGSGPFPVTVVVHGGYWKAQYDRSLMEGLCADLAAHGLAAWNIEYRRVGAGGGWPHTLDDVGAAVDLLAELDAPLDLSHVGAVGHSAGGHLAFWTASRPGLPADAPGGVPRVEIVAAVSQAGLLDLTLAAGLMPSSTPTRALLGDPVVNYERYVLASPKERLPLGIPQLVLHGDRDDTVSMRIATSYVAAARNAGDACELLVLNHTGHFEHIDAGSQAWHVARDWLVGQASAARS